MDNKCDSYHFPYIKNKIGKAAVIKKKKSIWRVIIIKLNRKGFNFPKKQVENRYKTLDRGYKKKTINNKKIGRNRASCEYEQ